jgi:MSHA biogenesis protein MshQ
VEGGVKVVSGRIKIPNMYGSEKLPLPIPITVQYYNGKDWRTSLTDSTTKFSSKVSTASGNLVADNTNCAVVTTPDTVPVAVSSGVRTLIFSRFAVTPPAPSCITKFSINAPTYLPNAGGGSATFGIFKSPLIYRRENY